MAHSAVLRVFLVIAIVFVIAHEQVSAANRFWSGDQDDFWITNNAGNTNWSSTLATNTDSGIVPSAADDAFFAVTPGALNLNTRLGADFSINSLTFTTASGGGPTTVD